MNRTAFATAILFLSTIGGAAAAPAPCRTIRHSSGILITTCVDHDPGFARIREDLVDVVSKGKLASVSVAAVGPSGVLWEESIGWSDRERKTAATPRTTYLMESVGKSMTATALMRLVEQKAIDLDAPVSAYLGNAHLTFYDGSPDALTVRRLLNMTAQIPHSNLEFTSLPARKEYSTARVVSTRGIVVFPPGTSQMYSNTNFGVLEQVIEEVSHKPYSTFLRDALFRPAGMNDSWAGVTATKRSDAVPYQKDGKPVPPVHPMLESSRGIHASLEDLIRFARLHLGDTRYRVLKPETLTLMHSSLNGVPRGNYALGIGSGEILPGRPLLIANGRASGAQATIAMMEREQIAAICLINTTGDQADEVSFRIVDVLVPGFMDAIGKVVAELSKPARTYEATPDLAGEWVGSIRNPSRPDLPIKLTFQSDGDIHVRVADQLETLVSGVGYDEGRLTGTFLADIPAEESAGHAHRVTISLNQNAERMSGFITSNITNDRGTFVLPSYVVLQKKPATISGVQ